MPQSAFIKLVNGSAKNSITVDELKELLAVYIAKVEKTGAQLDWDYSDRAFPYTIEEREDGKGKWFFLKGKNQKEYKYLIMGTGAEEKTTDAPSNLIQIVIPDDHTHGDKGKANEFCKYIAKELKGELHLFNGRVMYFNPRK